MTLIGLVYTSYQSIDKYGQYNHSIIIIIIIGF